MSITASESRSPLGESQAAERRGRLVHLGLMVFELMREKAWGGTIHEFDGVEDANLLAALRACSFYVDQIGCLDFGDTLVVQIKGIDGHDYILRFSLFEPGLSVHASRVRITSLPLVAGPGGQVESTSSTLDILGEYSKQLKLGRMTIDRAFLVGMSVLIGFMDDPDEEDPDEPARLAPLSAQVMLTDDELRDLRTKLPPSTINYDDEGDQPY